MRDRKIDAKSSNAMDWTGTYTIATSHGVSAEA